MLFSDKKCSTEGYMCIIYQFSIEWCYCESICDRLQALLRLYFLIKRLPELFSSLQFYGHTRYHTGTYDYVLHNVTLIMYAIMTDVSNKS